LVTDAAGEIAKGVVARRPAQRVGDPLAGQHQAGAGDRALGAGDGRAPGLGADRAGEVGHVVARLADRRAGIAGAAAVGVHVGQYVVGGALDAPPARVGVFQELQVLGRVDGGERPAAGVVGGEDLVAGTGGRLAQHVGALRHLRARPHDAVDQEDLGAMAARVLVKQHFHVAGPPA
jgi:hypothetical protein